MSTSSIQSIITLLALFYYLRDTAISYHFILWLLPYELTEQIYYIANNGKSIYIYYLSSALLIYVEMLNSLLDICNYVKFPLQILLHIYAPVAISIELNSYRHEIKSNKMLENLWQNRHFHLLFSPMPFSSSRVSFILLLFFSYEQSHLQTLLYCTYE